MALSNLVERFSRTPPHVRILAFAGVTVLFGAVFYFVFYSGLSDEAIALDRQITNLVAQKANYERKSQEYNLIRAKVSNLLEERKELVKILPNEAAIASFLQLVHAQAELAGLNILNFVQRNEVKRGFYATIPVKMSITGSFHNITKFFYSTANLKRIVNVQNLQLGSPRMTKEGVMLRASFMASTFRFLEAAKKVGVGMKKGRRG
ncbi:MAG: type 4a pilus biogenesis protein PilO [Pseudomonadota bacterium]